MFSNLGTAIVLIVFDIFCLSSLYFIGYYTGKARAKSELMDIELKCLQELKYKRYKEVQKCQKVKNTQKQELKN